MNITTIGRKCSPNDTFKERAEMKLSKVDKFLNGEADAKITATAQKNKVTVEVTVIHGTMIYRAESTNSDINQALDDCIDVIVRKIRKNKTKLSKQIKSGALDDLTAKLEPVAEEIDFDVVRTKTMSVKPQTVEEAILQMNMLGHQFYMFLNPDTNLINVVYHRRDGGYGVLEPNE